VTFRSNVIKRFVTTYQTLSKLLSSHPSQLTRNEDSIHYFLGCMARFIAYLPLITLLRTICSISLTTFREKYYTTNFHRLLRKTHRNITTYFPHQRLWFRAWISVSQIIWVDVHWSVFHHCSKRTHGYNNGRDAMTWASSYNSRNKTSFRLKCNSMQYMLHMNTPSTAEYSAIILNTCYRKGYGVTGYLECVQVPLKAETFFSSWATVSLKITMANVIQPMYFYSLCAGFN
jgi:hypothetical protein